MAEASENNVPEEDAPAASVDPALAAEIERACTQVSVAYAVSVDSHDFDSFATLFTEDAVLELGPNRFAGRDAIRAAVARHPAERVSRHVFSNILIEAVSETEARGITYLTLYQGESDDGPISGAIAPALVGHYHDQFRRTDEGWKFARRTLAVAFVDPARM